MKGQPQPCNRDLLVRCKHARKMQLRSWQSKQGAKGHRARSGCGWIRSSLHPAVRRNHLGFRAKTTQPARSGSPDHALYIAAPLALPWPQLQCYRCKHCIYNCDYSASATAAAAALLRRSLHLQLRLLQPCNHYDCKHNRNSRANASTNVSNNLRANANAMQGRQEIMACAADDANASANTSSNADAASMQRNSKHQCKRRCNIHASARSGAYTQACKRQTSTKYMPRHAAASKLQSKPTAPTSTASNPIQSEQCTQPVCMHPTSIHVPDQYTCIRQADTPQATPADLFL